MSIRGGPSRGGSGGAPGGGARGGSAAGGIYLAGEPIPPPNATVTAAEDELVKQTRGKIIDGFPGRRGYGTKGKSIVLRANYFAMTTAYEAKQPETPLYRYEVNVRQEISKPKKRRLFELLMQHPLLKDVHSATDFASILVTTEKLDEGKLNNDWQKVTLLSENSSQPAQQQGQAPDFVRKARDRNTFEVAIRYQSSFNLREMIEYLRSQSSGATYQGSADVIQILNIVLTKPPNEAASVKNVGQNKFYPFGTHEGMEGYNLNGGLEALRGYFSSVRPSVGRLLLNLNVTAGAFFKPMPLLLFLGGFCGQQAQLEAFIRMLKVEASYVKDGQKQPFMKKTKSIIGFAKPAKAVKVKRFGNAHEVKFKINDPSKPKAPQEITVAEYFKRQHGITLKQPDRSVLNVGTRDEPQYLPMELCNVLPGQAYRRLLSGDQTSEMLKFAARFPNLNGMSIAGTAQNPGPGLRLLRLADSSGKPDPQIQSVQPFGISVGTSMITVPGRILVTPQVKYAQKTITPRAGSWNCAEQKFSKPGKFNRWQVLIINRKGGRSGTLAEDGYNGMSTPAQLVDNFTKFLHDYGIQMGTRGPTQSLLLEPFTVQNRDVNDQQLKQFFAGAENNRVDIVLVIIPDVDKWLYARIKFHGDVTHGIGSICAVGSKIQKVNGQGMYFGNLALKFNLKGGGISHSVANTVMAPIDNNTMIVGIDVTHPSPGSAEGAPSIACLVASVDPQMFQWPGSIRTQTGKQEMVDALEEMMMERLKLWQKKNQQRLPTKIVVYRDGVSEGQYQTVLHTELPCLEKAFDKMYGAKAKHPKVAIIIVGKRHHTRFYPTKVEDADYNPQRDKGSWNPLPGTVVDRGITNKILREFYLQAHQGLQGTARPAHYVVIKDDISFEADQMEQFTHHLCYLFNRATKAVSICPPAYYADLLCERGRSYLFSALAEDSNSDSNAFAAGGWSGGVHPRLSETTWYV